MENIEEFKKKHSDSLLRHSLKDIIVLSGYFDDEIEYSIKQMGNYLYDIKHVLEQKMDYSIISHLTYNLNIQLLHSYNKANEYFNASRYYLIGKPNKDIQLLINDYQDNSKDIKELINKINQLCLLEKITHPADFLENTHYKTGLEGKNGVLLNLERDLSFMNGAQLLKCLNYLMDLTYKKLLDIRNGITYESNEFIEFVYDLNYVFYADNYWEKNKKNFRCYVENEELVNDVTPASLQNCYKDVLRDFKTNPVGKLWAENMGEKSELAYELKILPLTTEQWEYYFDKIFKLEELKRWIKELRTPAKTVKIKAKSKSGSKSQSQREIMTFKKKNSILREHLILLFNKLTQEGWIDGNEADFIALFSGKRDEECVLTWLNSFGKAALFALFKKLNDEGLISVPNGFALSSILEGHFQDASGQWLNGLDKGNKPNDKAKPVIDECVKLLQTDLQRLVNGYNQDDEDFQSVYDSYDHQDMHLHSR